MPTIPHSTPDMPSRLLPASIQAISFDLDDTLWPITPVIRRAETAVHEWFAEQAPAVAERFDVEALRELRLSVEREHPELAHDLSALRRRSLRQACRHCGVDEALAEQAFQVFFAARNRVSLYPDARPCLAQLSARLPLIALSNGNADLGLTGIDAYFHFSLSAIEAGAAKPAPDMFLQAAERLALAPEQILHVGDDPETDIGGARAAGCHAILLDRQERLETPPGVPVIRSLSALHQKDLRIRA